MTDNTIASALNHLAAALSNQGIETNAVHIRLGLGDWHKVREELQRGFATVPDSARPVPPITIKYHGFWIEGDPATDKR